MTVDSKHCWFTTQHLFLLSMLTRIPFFQLCHLKEWYPSHSLFLVKANYSNSIPFVSDLYRGGHVTH